MQDETMLARIPKSQRLAWRLADALLLIAHGRELDLLAEYEPGVTESPPLFDRERRHAVYEAACALSSENDGPIEVEPLLHAIDALLEEHRDVHRHASRLLDELEQANGWRRRFEQGRREHAESRTELRQSLGIADDERFASAEDEWAHLLARVAELRNLATAAGLRDAAESHRNEGHPTKTVWERLREDG